MVQSLRGRGKASHAAPLLKERAAGARAVEIPGSRAGTFRRIGFRVLFAFVLTRLVIVPESSRFMRAHFKKGPVHTCTHARAHTHKQTLLPQRPLRCCLFCALWPPGFL